MNPEACAKLTDLMRDVSVAMLTTTAEDGSLRSRPMGIPKYEFEGELWFFTAVDAPKAGELAEDERVNVSLAEPKHERYVSIRAAPASCATRSRPRNYGPRCSKPGSRADSTTPGSPCSASGLTMRNIGMPRATR